MGRDLGNRKATRWSNLSFKLKNLSYQPPFLYTHKKAHWGPTSIFTLWPAALLQSNLFYLFDLNEVFSILCSLYELFSYEIKVNILNKMSITCKDTAHTPSPDNMGTAVSLLVSLGKPLVHLFSSNLFPLVAAVDGEPTVHLPEHLRAWSLLSLFWPLNPILPGTEVHLGLESWVQSQEVG